MAPAIEKSNTAVIFSPGTYPERGIIHIRQSLYIPGLLYSLINTDVVGDVSSWTIKDHSFFIIH